MSSSTADREIIITRVLNAPRELVWLAWTDIKHLVNWWGPTGFTNTTTEFELKVGGTWRHIMHGPDGTDYPNRIIFEEIVPPEKLVYVHDSGEDGIDDAQFVATVTFEDEGDKTRVTMKSVFRTAKERDHVVKVYHAIEGGKQHLGRLDEYVQGLK